MAPYVWVKIGFRRKTNTGPTFRHLQQRADESSTNRPQHQISQERGLNPQVNLGRRTPMKIWTELYKKHMGQSTLLSWTPGSSRHADDIEGKGFSAIR
ncbi:MAG: hypothetical protein DMG49_14205 [Acidobacteria bacterium]|nr:MAG: hypothetical protein DMG49_14205 [Acidobacteriota bacterium]